MTHLDALPLHEGWTLTTTAGPVPDHIQGRVVPATVPGSAHTDLLAAGLIEDPFLGRNETDLGWAHRTHWRFATRFVTAPPADDERVDLTFDGLDTVAAVTLDGTELGRTANQHRSYRFDVRTLLAAGGEHELTVDFSPALEHAEQVEARLGFRPRPYPHPFNAVRKMACSFGWDWGPDFQTAGIWKPVRLERWRTARLASVRPLVTVADDGSGRVELHADLERAGLGDDDVALHLQVEVAGRTASVEVPGGATSAVVVLEVPEVELWWPVGYGEARLYELRATLLGPAGGLDTYERRIGFRTVEVDTSRDEHGTRFTFVVNGREVFVKGANWIPDDHFLTRITRERLERRVDQAVAAHMNMLRVWGGGIYETEDFYDVCDERGVMVWQDFLLACGAYAEEEPIFSEIVAEARENVARLTPHASLVLWNGANENMWGYRDWGWPADLQGRSWGLRFYQEVFPQIVAELDPTRPYSENSPYSPGEPIDGIHPNHPDHGTHHEWECWNRRDYAFYREDVPRFCSEFGWQGPATWATLTRAIPAAELGKQTETFLLHQKAEDGNGKLDRGLAPHLPIPTDFEDWHWATSLNQARAVAFAVEHYRSWWPRTAGSIVWQLNDCWPVTSWAAIDGDERLKPLWFALRAAYAPRLVTFQPREGGLAVVVVNDTDEARTTTATVRRRALDGTELAVRQAPVELAARSVATLVLDDAVAVPGDAAREYLAASLDLEGTATAFHLFAEDRDVAYDPAGYVAEASAVPGGYEVRVRASSFVRDLTLLVDKVDPDATVNEQLVTLEAGSEAVLRVVSERSIDPAELTSPRVLRSVNALVTGV